MNIAIFIFRRDLRLFDNTTLNKIKDNYKNLKILPIFIFNKNQIDKDKNTYYSSNAVQFLFESLDELSILNFYYTDNDITIFVISYFLLKFFTLIHKLRQLGTLATSSLTNYHYYF